MRDAMPLGEIVEALRRADMSGVDRDWCPVDTPFGWLAPSHLHSYRGFYDQLALTVEHERHDEPWLTREELVRLFAGAIGKGFTAYKGGNYCMTAESLVWVTLDSSRTSDLVIVGVTEDGVIETGEAPY